MQTREPEQPRPFSSISSSKNYDETAKIAAMDKTMMIILKIPHIDKAI